MKTNRVIQVLAAALFLVSTTCSFLTLKNQDDHFINVSSKNYVVVLFADLKKQSKLKKPIDKLLSRLSSSKTVKSNDVIVELADTATVPYFDSHYDLEGKPGLRLFIRNQMLDNKELASKVAELGGRGANEAELADSIEKWVADAIARISLEIKDADSLWEFIREHKIIGLYSGSRGSNFDEYFRVARKHIDFPFAHTFDTKLANKAYAELGNLPAPQSDSFAIIRDVSSLTEFDPLPIVTFNHFNERELTEFIEFERYEKMRSTNQTASIYAKLFNKHQPMLLFTGAPESSPEYFHLFTQAVKQLPKNMIYGHTDVKSKDSGVFHQLFMGAQEALLPNTINIVHAGVDSKIKIEQLTGKLSVSNIKDFASKFMSDKAHYFQSIRNYMYDIVEDVKGHNKEEKEEVTDTEL